MKGSPTNAATAPEFDFAYHLPSEREIFSVRWLAVWLKTNQH